MYFFILLLNLIVSICIMLPVKALDEASFNELFNCNLAKKDIAKLCNIDYELELYFKSLANESNYRGIPTLMGHNDPDYNYPHLNPIHQVLLDTVLSLQIKNVCDLGAGCGKISKFIYANRPEIDITCIENNAHHLIQMKENFETNTGIIKPNITVNAKQIKGCLPDLSSLSSEEYDLVFTCTVMMHLPFIVAVKSAQEIVRISKKFILHVENKNEGTSWYNMTVVNVPGMSSFNCIGIDYVKLYESLGVKTLRYFEFKDIASPATYVLYLGQKV